MKFYYYVHTGHRIGLDRFRRACTIIRSLGDIDITLLCSDYRIAQVARDFGVDKSVGIDVVRNIPHIAVHGDKMIFDSEEANPIMLDDMRNFFSTFIRISDDKDDNKKQNELLISPYLEEEGICSSYVIDDKYFVNHEKTIKIAYFFGDDDYEKDIEKHLDFIQDLKPDILLGFYYFLDYEEFLKKTFSNYYEFEEYDEVIQKSEILITASPQAVLENLASGGKPIYIQREDYTSKFQPLFRKFGVPIIKDYNKNYLYLVLETLSRDKYKNVIQNGDKIADFIKECIK
ncbi:MAG: hypothetical protein L3J10_01940 [Sulfurimonas sp.]|nr:hypothetical protein [Sulfurimonas sp.]